MFPFLCYRSIQVGLCVTPQRKLCYGKLTELLYGADSCCCLNGTNLSCLSVTVRKSANAQRLDFKFMK